MTLVLTPEPGEGFGLDIDDDCVVTAVHEDSAAEVAGVVVGTVIVSVDGAPTPSKEDIIPELTREDAGESATCVRSYLLPSRAGPFGHTSATAGHTGYRVASS